MKLLYITLAVFVFALSFVAGFKIRAQELGVKTYDIGDASALPVLTGTSSSPILSGQGIIAVDADSKVTMYEKNADQQLYPASTTKIVTALVGLDYYKLDDVLTVKDPAVDGQRMGLMANEQMTFNNLLNGLLIYSANDAAITIADNYPGGRIAFVDAMNSKVQSLHLEHSHFANPVGFDDFTQVTTASDMVRVSEVAMENPVFSKIVGTENMTVQDVTGHFSHNLKNVNQLLGVVPGVYGIKTGWTEAARENLITFVNRDNHRVYIAILGSQDRFGETKELINWIYGNYSWQKIGYVQKAVGMILN